MKKKKVIGIDLGTTFSKVSHITDSGAVEVIPNADGDLKSQSIVSWASGKPIVGKAALPDLILAPQYVAKCTKRYMGKETADHKPISVLTNPSGRELTPVDAAAAVLNFLKKSAEEYLGCEIEDAVITVPAYFDEFPRNNTIAAAQIAGFKNIKLLNEPEAAAIYYGLSKARNETIAITDTGGGTTDVTAMEIEDGKVKGVVSDGDENLGGSDYDEAIFEYACNEARANGIEISAEKDVATFYQNLDRAREAKEMLARREDVTLIVEAEGKRIPIKFTRAMLREVGKPFDERFISCCSRLLEQLKAKGKKPDRVLLVGGNSRLYGASDMVKGVFGIEPSRDEDADLIVSKGAAIWAKTCFGEKDKSIELGGHRYLASEIKMQTVAAHAICVAARKSRTDSEEYNFAIVPANTTLPHEFEKRFAPIIPGATEVVVKLVQSRENELSRNSTLLRKIVVPIQPSDTDSDRILIKGRYTEEGLIELTIIDLLLGKAVSDSFIYKAGLSQAEIDQKRKDLLRDMGD